MFDQSGADLRCKELPLGCGNFGREHAGVRQDVEGKSGGRKDQMHQG